MAVFTGSGVAIVTPFNEDFTINYQQFKNLIEFHIDNKTDAIVVCGTTGEASTLNDEEHRSLIKFTVETVNKRIPVIAGTGSNDTEHGVSLSQFAEQVGVDALLCVTPYYNKSSQEGLFQHFKAYANSVNIPIILYNVPSRTGMSFEIDTLKRLSKISNIVGLKEASGDISYAMEILRQTSDDFELYAGNDEITLPMVAIGAKGVISVVANLLPRETHDLIHLYKDGNQEEALALQMKLNVLNHAMSVDVNPIPIKTAMNYQGFNVGSLRLPLWPMSEEETHALSLVVDSFHIGGHHV